LLRVNSILFQSSPTPAPADGRDAEPEGTQRDNCVAQLHVFHAAAAAEPNRWAAAGKSAMKMNKRLTLAVALAMLVLAILACAERSFTDTHVYAAMPGFASEFYDQAADRILQDDVWVFRPDGKYSAIVQVEGNRLTLSGRYGGDDAGNGFYFSIDTNNDGEYDDSLYASEGFSYIEWRRSSGTLKYVLAP
jgi:hypothetical protein